MIVVHNMDRMIIKGFTNDFFPNKDMFHMTDKETGNTIKVETSGLKGIYFVKSFEGNKDYQDRFYSLPLRPSEQ